MSQTSTEKPTALVGTHVTRTIVDKENHWRIKLRFVVASAEYVDVRCEGQAVDVINILDNDLDQTTVSKPGDLARVVNEWISGQTPADIIHNVTEAMR